MSRIKSSTTTFTSLTEFETAIDRAATLQLKLEADIAAHNKEKAAQDKAFKSRVKTAQAKINEIIVSAEP